jgi:site-specific recombinase XerC
VVEVGVDLYTVKNLLGHSSIKVTERYVKFQLSVLEKVRGVLDSGVSACATLPRSESEVAK